MLASSQTNRKTKFEAQVQEILCNILCFNELKKNFLIRFNLLTGTRTTKNILCLCLRKKARKDIQTMMNMIKNLSCLMQRPNNVR